MTVANLVNACPSCGAEESFDVLLARMVEDTDTRRLIADLVEKGMSLGGRVMRYLRLHKPPKQRMRMSRVHELLAELVTDINRGAITRKGREWAAPVDSWQAGIEAVFDAVDNGTLKTPLQGNGYLYEVMLRMADRHEATKERETETSRRNARSMGAIPMSLADAIADMETAVDVPSAVDALASRLVALPPPPAGPSAYARRIHAQNAARHADRVAGAQEINSATNEERTEE